MSNATQNPYEQVFTVNLTNGNQFVFSLAELDDWYLDALWCSIQYASQLGASLMLLVVLALLTAAKKRANLLFALNLTALLFAFLRMLLACCYFVGPFNEVYTYFSMDYSTLPTYAYGVSIASEIFTVLLHLVVTLSLLLQVHVVCMNLRRNLRLPLLVVSGVIGAAAVGMRCYLAGLNIKAILNPFDPTGELSSASDQTDYITTAAIFWFSAVFVAKLGHALYQRRKLGIRRWSSMQVIFIMGCQTMIVPAIFSIVQHSVDFPAVSSFVLTLVALFLPLSTLWATTTLDGKTVSLTPVNGRRVTPSSGISSGKGINKSVTISHSSTTFQNDTGSPTIGKSEEVHEIV